MSSGRAAIAAPVQFTPSFFRPWARRDAAPWPATPGRAAGVAAPVRLSFERRQFSSSAASCG
eukprot:14480686-Alexandrium_andersonii.AAC.1